MKRAWRRTTAPHAVAVRKTMPPSSDRRDSRKRAGWTLVSLACGAGLLWWTWSWWQRSHAPEDTAGPTTQGKDSGRTGPRIKRSASVRVDPSPTAPPTPEAAPPRMAGAENFVESAPFIELPEERQEKRISVRVTDSRGRAVDDAIVESEDCGLFMMTDRGRAEAITYEDGCTLQAGRRDGALMAWSDPVFLDLAGLSQASLTLEVPFEKTAGMGIQVIPGVGGIGVRGVVPGSPAERSGVQPGDVITAVDGISTAEMSVREFVEIGTGPVGTRVTLSIQRTSESATSGMEFTLVRQPIEQVP